MGEIITYKNEGPKKPVYCQIKLESGERVLITISQSGLIIYKLRWGGLIPGKKIFESDDILKLAELFSAPNKNPLDSVIEEIKSCRSTKEINEKLKRNL